MQILTFKVTQGQIQQMAELAIYDFLLPVVSNSNQGQCLSLWFAKY